MCLSIRRLRGPLLDGMTGQVEALAALGFVSPPSLDIKMGNKQPVLAVSPDATESYLDLRLFVGASSTINAT